MKHFFAQPGDIYDGTIKLPEHEAKQLRALQYDADRLFVVCDGECNNYVCRLGSTEAGLEAQDGEMTVQILSKHRAVAEPSIGCTVYIPYAKTEQLSYAVEKSVELGACKIVLYRSQLSANKPAGLEKKIEKLQKAARNAAKRSCRGIIPEVSAVDASDEFRYVLDVAADADDLAILFSGNDNNLRISTVLEHYFPLNVHFPEPLEKVRSVAVITGPEEGFAPSEIKLAQSKGISLTSQGPRPLGQDTAPVAALSAIMYHTGNL